ATVVTAGPLKLDLRDYRLELHEETIHLPKKEFELLYQLAAFPSRVFTRDELIEQVWGLEFEGERRRFVSSVSHEFQTPLTSIKGYASELVATTDGDAKAHAAIIRDEASRLSDLTRQLLLLARLDEANVSLTTPVDVRASIEDVIRRHTFQLDEKGIAVATELDSTLIVTGDPLLLAQVWSNLLTNAIHASADGGLITIKAYQGERPTVSIQDVGVGMDEATKARLFERFYKGDSSRSGRGTGLGLAIARDIVHLHGGTLTVESQLGAGTVFYVTL
ncbi:MAG: ATP-binding protein, partial [Exiguobacterium chiriqhucha]